jgi:hypothetical protein
MKLACRDAFAAGIAAFSAGQFDDAAAIFDRIVAEIPGDRAPTYFLQRCRLLTTLAHPEWDGVADERI